MEALSILDLDTTEIHTTSDIKNLDFKSKMEVEFSREILFSDKYSIMAGS